LLVETDAFLAAAHEIWDDQIVILPHPTPLSSLPVAPVTNEFTIYVPGENRVDKGASLVPHIIRALSKQQAATEIELRFLVHGTKRSDFGRVKIESLSAFSSSAEYTANWQRAHAALLLHDPRLYRLRGSGVASDAVSAGRPYICLKGGSLAESASLISEPSPDAIANAILLLIRDYEAHARRCAEVAFRFQNKVSLGLAGLIGLT
jgi:hypothetical protein